MPAMFLAKFAANFALKRVLASWQIA